MHGAAEARPAGGPERVGLQKLLRSLFLQPEWLVVYTQFYNNTFGFGQSSCSLLANPRATCWPILVLHFGCFGFSWLSEPKSFVSVYKSTKK